MYFTQGPQIFENDETEQGFDLTAETALIEIASVLEHTGKNLRNSDNEILCKSATHILPYQISNNFFDEIFEYVEVKDSKVVRRWWATEKNNSRRLDIRDLFLSPNHKDNEFNGKWTIDCSGQVDPSIGGWESCRNLLGSKEPTFDSRRKFDYRHPFRRRRWFRKIININKDRHKQQARYINNDAVMFHQPVLNPAPPFGDMAQALSFLSSNISDFQKGDTDDDKKSLSLHASPILGDGTLRVLVKIGDGTWSEPM